MSHSLRKHFSYCLGLLVDMTFVSCSIIACMLYSLSLHEFTPVQLFLHSHILMHANTRLCVNQSGHEEKKNSMMKRIKNIPEQVNMCIMK